MRGERPALGSISKHFMASPVVLPFAGPPGGSVPAARGHPHQFLKPEIPPRRPPPRSHRRGLRWPRSRSQTGALHRPPPTPSQGQAGDPGVRGFGIGRNARPEPPDGVRREYQHGWPSALDGQRVHPAAGARSVKHEQIYLKEHSTVVDLRNSLLDLAIRLSYPFSDPIHHSYFSHPVVGVWLIYQELCFLRNW